MQYAPQQSDAIDSVGQWIKLRNSPVFHLFGYAGTGKTTLAKHIAGLMNGTVLFGAYTGKAAHVLQTKGCSGAATIHSMIYHSREKSKKRLQDLENALQLLGHELLTEFNHTAESLSKHPRYAELKRQVLDERKLSDRPSFIRNPDSVVAQADLLIIDECSMVDAQMGADLLSFGTPILVLGDPAQLPPVGGEGYFTKDVTPDVMLDEIHRQAADNPIIRMATELRNQRFLQLGDYGEGCRVIEGRLDPEEVLSYDQILVGKNVTRRGVNRRIRNLKGIEDPYPIVGDRVVCLKNNTDLGLLNGAVFNVTDVTGVMDNKVFMSVQPEGDMASIGVGAHEHHFLGKEDELPWYEKMEADMFDYGYGLTVHKSQGSQWNNVMLFDESSVFKADRWKWAYTGVTRAAEKIVIHRS